MAPNDEKVADRRAALFFFSTVRSPGPLTASRKLEMDSILRVVLFARRRSDAGVVPKKGFRDPDEVEKGLLGEGSACVEGAQLSCGEEGDADIVAVVVIVAADTRR